MNPTTDQFDDSVVLSNFDPVVRRWFAESFDAPTVAQEEAWPAIARGDNTLLLAPTGSGKTLAAFLVAIDRIMFKQRLEHAHGVRILYISPLKALGVDVERNLREPIAGVRALAEGQDVSYHSPRVGIRSGDTPAADRYRLNRNPPDILITTPESLYLMLTSKAREVLKTVQTVIVDEIHSMVATKRGAHLFVSLERLETLREVGGESHAQRMQRIGLSATQRPLEEVARLLGGGEATANPDESPRSRPVEIIEAGRSGRLELRIEVPVEDMARLTQQQAESRTTTAGPALPSIWPSIHPRLVELIRGHRSTMIFVNSRRLAERLAAAINELAEEEIAMAHHGSIAKQTRLQIEERLKRGDLPAIVATSSLELGIDMGAVDLVIQIEAPPSITSGIQRIGRSGHQVGAKSTGIIFPKYRGDLLACSAATERMTSGEVEETIYPRNPLDVLAQQIVAMVALEPVPIDQLYETVRRAAPFHELPRVAFEGVLDLLAGRYPSDEFAELRPRVTWDRIEGTIQPRHGSQRLAILNAGTIPDRGLYGVFLASAEGGGSRVGELDEEMVFETRPGDVFLLGASSWRVLDVTQDRVMVEPAPGEPGRMPFWRGDSPGRPLEFGQAIGKLARRLASVPRDVGERELVSRHGLDARAARNLISYLHDQLEATGEVPSDSTIVVESFLDEVGDWRVVILSPFGSRVHAPWAMAVAGKLREEIPGEVDMTWSNDGIVFRLSESDHPPPAEIFFPAASEVEDIVMRELGSSALFAARFRENAARALLLPRRQPGRRTPLWLQRRKAADLLAVASRYPSFPIMLETYRECLRDVFDIKGLKSVLQDVQGRVIQIRAVQTRKASPFASSLVFNYTANFLYDGDAPLAERRAATLALDHAQLRELLGDAELRELLDGEVADQLALELQRLGERYRVKHVDALHDLLLHLGPLARDELMARCEPKAVETGEFASWLEELCSGQRVIEVNIADVAEFAAAEDAARLRDALDVELPSGLPDAFLASVQNPLDDMVSRFARTHAPFKAEDAASRFDLSLADVHAALGRLAAADRILEGEFLPGGRGREWCDTEVLRVLKRRSLAKLRKQVEPVEPAALARFLPAWQGITRPRRGLDGLLDVIDQLQGVPLPASTLETDILPSRVIGYQPNDLDELCVAGEIVWRGCESVGARDGRIALYLTDYFGVLAPAAAIAEGEVCDQLRDLLASRGALFFEDIVRELDMFRHDVLDAIWQLVWCGEVTNDTLAPLRSLGRDSQQQRRRERGRGKFRSRRTAKMPGSEGRWSLLPRCDDASVTVTERQTAIASQLVERYGILTREMVHAEGVSGGFSGLYPVLKAMEESGRLRRGYFVAGLGAAQFAAPGADDRLRSQLSGEEDPEVLVLAATDPASPYGAALAWPEKPQLAARPQRVAGAHVILRNGGLMGFIGRTGQNLITFLPDTEPDNSYARDALITALVGLSKPGGPMLLAKVDGVACGESSLAESLEASGFVPTSRGFLFRLSATPKA